mmetsp:Transcript_16472/g.46725  ORF Transcript_16472/g.46725 Transcript_16472/m.46725 type:complete len:291 (+) Transcript_16472:554-1426(+)
MVSWSASALAWPSARQACSSARRPSRSPRRRSPSARCSSSSRRAARPASRALSTSRLAASSAAATATDSFRSLASLLSRQSLRSNLRACRSLSLAARSLSFSATVLVSASHFTSCSTHAAWCWSPRCLARLSAASEASSSASVRLAAVSCSKIFAVSRSRSSSAPLSAEWRSNCISRSACSRSRAPSRDTAKALWRQMPASKLAAWSASLRQAIEALRSCASAPPPLMVTFTTPDGAGLLGLRGLTGTCASGPTRSISAATCPRPPRSPLLAAAASRRRASSKRICTRSA